jgi:hypothetical protein
MSSGTLDIGVCGSVLVENNRSAIAGSRFVFLAVVGVALALLLFLAWQVSQGEVYEAGSDLGYNLGLLGGLMMLSLLAYSVRKRLFPHDRLGKMETWFKYHMCVGITSPILILFHSTFKTASVNGAFALYSMLLVGLSGVVGRFIYRHIHQGLYGKQLTLENVVAELKTTSERVDSVFYLQPEIENRLHAFQAEAFATGVSSLPRAWRFLLLSWRARQLAKSVRLEAKLALRKAGAEGKAHPDELKLNYQLARKQIDEYLESVVKASQFAVWERLFSAWHLIHVPFLYLLVFSGIVHVVAVHMY